MHILSLLYNTYQPYRTAILIVVDSSLFVVLSSKLTCLSNKDSEDIPNIPRALTDRFAILIALYSSRG